MSAEPAELYVLQNGAQAGPFPRDAIRSMVDAGALKADDLVWAEGMPEWQTIRSVLKIAGASKPPGGAILQAGGNPESFFSQLQDAFSYPFRGDGWILICVGTVFFVGLGFISRFGGLYGLALKVFLWGYLLLMLQQVVQGSAQGEKVVPHWPAFEGWGDVWEACFKWGATFVLCFSLAILAAMITEEEMLFWLGCAIGGFYFPMAILGVAMFDSVAGVNPALVVPSIFRVFGNYLVVVLVLGGMMVVNSFSGKLEIPVLGGLIEGFNSLYSSILYARLLGILYYCNRQKLAWF